MNQVVLRAKNPEYRLVRCQRALLFNRNRLHLHSAQTCDQERCAESLAIDFSVDLTRRFVNSKLSEQARKLLVADAAFRHFYLYQLLCALLPSLIGLSTLIWQSFHRPSSHFTLPSLVTRRLLSTAILGRIRPIANRQHYTSKEQFFCGASLLRRNSTDFFGSQFPMTGNMR